MDGGEGTRDLADLLHGTWLGHPLHSVLTDVVVGAWGIGSFFDLLSLFNRSERAEITADSLVELGNYAALPTILAGLADFSTIPEHAADTGITHATINATAFSLYLASKQERSNGERDRAIALSTLAFSLLMVGAYLGGHMVYDQKVGVNHAAHVSGPQEWTPVMAAEELQAGQPMRVDADGSPVLLYRQGDGVMAIGAVCAHAGGPLEQGQFYNGKVQCPWHDSVYSLQDGCVVHGPSTYPVPKYDARLRDGQVEVRLAPYEMRGQ
jgi:nitrite reductase/ring-hydroxylating ferredoxin subunit